MQPTITRLHSWGGQSKHHDFQMSDGSIRTLSEAEAIHARPFKVTLEQRGSDWLAYPWGKSAPIVRPAPGNTRPASAATWPTCADALAELPALLGGPIEVVNS